MNLAIIPVKKNSVRIKNKAYQKVNNKCLIDHVIDTVLQSKLYDRVIISTNDNVNIPIRALANDIDVLFRSDDECNKNSILSVIDHLKSKINTNIYDTISLIYPTAIFTTKDDLVSAYTMLEDNYSIMSVKKINKSYRAITEKKEYLFKNYTMTQSQDLPNLYIDAGQFYIFNNKLNINKLFNKSSKFYIMPSYIIDIDTYEDLYAVRKIFNP